VAGVGGKPDLQKLNCRIANPMSPTDQRSHLDKDVAFRQSFPFEVETYIDFNTRIGAGFCVH